MEIDRVGTVRTLRKGRKDSSASQKTKFCQGVSADVSFVATAESLCGDRVWQWLTVSCWATGTERAR